jgi:PASTA domain
VNRLEDRLRDALGATAETVRPESVTGLPDPSRVTRTRHVAALAAAAAVAVVIIGASVSTPLFLAGGHAAPSRPAGPAATSPAALASPSGAAVTVVPDVVDTMVNQATSLLRDAGLQVMVVEQASSAFPPGCVIAQSPVAGTRSPAGATVVLSVAAAPGPSVP